MTPEQVQPSFILKILSVALRADNTLFLWRIIHFAELFNHLWGVPIFFKQTFEVGLPFSHKEKPIRISRKTYKKHVPIRDILRKLHSEKATSCKLLQRQVKLPTHFFRSLGARLRCSQSHKLKRLKKKKAK